MTASKRVGIREGDATFCNLIILICFVFLLLPTLNKSLEGQCASLPSPKISFQFKSAKFEVLKTGPTLD